MLELTLVRHASTALNEARRYQGRSDEPLSALGRSQAVRLRPRLREVDYDAVIRGDAKRCAETLELGLPGRAGEVDPRLRELGFGRWEGRTYSECEALDSRILRAWIADPSAAAPPGGESFAEFCRRVDDWLDGFRHAGRAGRAVVVAHAGTIRRIVARTMDLEWRHVAAMKLDTCGITRLELYRGGARLICLNDTAHLTATPHPNHEIPG